MSFHGSRGGKGGVLSTAYVPPANFSAITTDIYRSAYPVEANVPYLHHIGIRTVVLLSIEALPTAVMKALKEPHGASNGPASDRGREGAGAGSAGNGQTAPPTPAEGTPFAVRTKQRHPGESAFAGAADAAELLVVEVADMSSWRTDCLNSNDEFSQKDVTRALDFAVDVQWHPVLFCCPTGELQTSVVTGCMRRYQGWCLASIFGECELFANLQQDLRPSLMSFIEAWQPEEYPFSMTGIIQRNREWVKDRVQQSQQQRRKQRRLLRQQQHHQPLSLRGGSSGGGSVTLSSHRGSDESENSSEDENDAHMENSTRSGDCFIPGLSPDELRTVSSLQPAPPQQQPQPLQQQQQHKGEEGGAAGEGVAISSSGMRPPSAWQRRYPKDSTVASVSGSRRPPSSATGGNREEGVNAGALLSNPLGPAFAAFRETCLTEVVYAEWFKEARRRNPGCCIDAAEPISPLNLLESDGGPSAQRDRFPSAGGKGNDPREARFPPSDSKAKALYEPPPHERYAGVRNPPVLDERSTFTKQSIVDDDDD